MYKNNQNNNAPINQTTHPSEQSTANSNLSTEAVDALVLELSSQDPASFEQDFTLLQETPADAHLQNPPAFLDTRNSLSTTATTTYSRIHGAMQSNTIVVPQYKPTQTIPNNDAIYAKEDEFIYDKDIVLDEGTFVPAGTRIIKMGWNRHDTEYYARSEDPRIKDQKVIRKGGYHAKRLVYADGTFVPPNAKIYKKEIKKNNARTLFPYFEITEDGLIQVYTLTSIKHQQAKKNKKLNVAQKPNEAKENHKKTNNPKKPKKSSRSETEIMHDLLQNPSDLNQETINLLQSSFLATTEVPIPEEQVEHAVPVHTKMQQKPFTFTFQATALNEPASNTTPVALNVFQPHLKTYQSNDENLKNYNHFDATNVFTPSTGHKRKDRNS